MNEEEALIAQLGDSLGEAERHLHRELTEDESDQMVERMLWQVGKGQAVDPASAFGDVHPDGDPYDLDTRQGRVAYMEARINRPLDVEGEDSPEVDPAHELPLDASERERRDWMDARLHGDTERIERIVDVIHERAAKPEADVVAD